MGSFFGFGFVYFHASLLRNLGSENSRVGNEEAIRSSLQGCLQSPEAFLGACASHNKSLARVYGKRIDCFATDPCQ